jgi:hypothetical protein
LEANESVFNETIDAILEWAISSVRPTENESFLDLLSAAIDSHRYTASFRHSGNIPLKDVWVRRPEKLGFAFVNPPNAPPYQEAEKISSFLGVIRGWLEAPVRQWSTSLEPWDSIVEKGRSLWGDKLQLIRLGVVAAGIRSPQETGAEHSELFDSNKSLCKRLRYARLKSGVKSWWANQLSRANTDAEGLLAALTLLTWASGRTIIALAPPIESVLESLGSKSDLVIRSIRAFDPTDIGGGKLTFDMKDLPSKMDPILAAALYSRCKQPTREQIYERFLAGYSGNNLWILRCIQEQVLQKIRDSGRMSASDVDLISRAYSAGVTGNRYALQTLGRNSLDWMTVEIAEQIAENPGQYPRQLVSTAEKKFRQLISSQTVPVGDIAQRDQWFAEV